ncbi:unnamed protein product [Cylindrotheca closterium]|uniref:Uncharacterized protein n=1 Tax=Cylindrotheca closterium TaxID=2856 RepID=A0AAD2FYP2_9STRA|nr:unnamed protein product [Cylindrotheca closterium]
MRSYRYFGNKGETIPDDVEDLIVVHPHVQEIPKRACYMFEGLTSVTFSGSALRTIGERVFFNCFSLLEIEIPSSVTSIGDHAFWGCRSMTKVRFIQEGGSSLKTIGIEAFCYCSSLTEVNIPSSVETIQSGAFKYCKCLARVFFQEGLKTIESGVFIDCIELEKVDLPKTLEILGNGAFKKCSSLQVVNMEEGGNLRVIGRNAFENCVKLQTINMPSTVERLESQTFKECDSLLVVKFQNGLKYVGNYAFYWCKNLRSVALPESVEVISSWAFGLCPKLLSVELGDGPRDLGIHDGAFSGCASLINICLPSEPRIGQTNPDDVGPGVVVVNSFNGCMTLRKQYGNTPIPLALMRRFDNFPIHKKCYHASVTTTDELSREIESSMPSFLQDENTIPDHLVDPFGMTPFHILMSAANCRLDLLQLLLDAYPPNILGWKDMNGKTAIEYYWQQSYRLTENSQRILQAALHRWLVGSISSWKGLEAWKSDMTNRVNAIVSEDEVEQRQSLLQDSLMALSHYEHLEATSLLELSLWKMEMRSADDTSTDDDTAARIIVDKKADREAYRIGNGAPVVIPNVIEFSSRTDLALSSG